MPDGNDLHRRFAPTFVLAGVVLLLLAGVLTAAYGEGIYRSHRARAVDVQARMLAASVAGALEFTDAAAVRANVEAMRANSDVEAAAVYDRAGALVAGYGRPDGPSRAASGAAARADGRIIATMPVVSNGQQVGSVRLLVPIEPFARRLTRYGGIALLAIMGSLVVAVLGVGHAAMRRVNAELAVSNQRLRDEASERAHAEAALRQAQKMQAVGQLTGGIAHDFNNLLTPITGGLEFIAPHIADERMRRLANNALEAARRGVKLTGQLLAFSRVQRLGTSPVRVNDVIEGMRDLLIHTIGATVVVRLEPHPAAGSALCDANQLENAILNLAINARDAMPSGGTLTIATGRETEAGDHVAITVTDTGAGMSPDVLEHAARPFFTTKPLGQGTGLGLAQVCGIVHHYGGRMRIDSRVGEGTTVRILLPSAAEETATAFADEADRPARSGRRSLGADIVVIDDDDEVRLFLTDTLEALGHRVRTASGGEAGLHMLDGTSPDLLLVDYAMPGRNGVDVSLTARARHPVLPIVVMTGYAEGSSLQDALGPDTAILRKPFGIEDLVAVLDGHLAPASRAVQAS